MASTVLVAGSLHLDLMVAAPHLPARDETVTGQAVTEAFGGKGGNQAVAAARMGARVHMAGAVGTDAFAATLRGALSAAGVDHTRVQTVPGASGMSVAITLPDGDYGAVIVSGANLAFDPRAVTFPRGCRALVLQNEVPGPANLVLARLARSARIPVILNAAPARDLGDLWPMVDVLIVNRGEAAALAGPGDPVAQAAALQARTGGRVIVTLGGQGVATVDGLFPARPVAVVSTHGAGDMFTGAFVAALTGGMAFDHSIAFAQMAAALFVAAPVADRAQVTADAVRRTLG
jgi:ribokinase